MPREATARAFDPSVCGSVAANSLRSGSGSGGFLEGLDDAYLDRFGSLGRHLLRDGIIISHLLIVLGTRRHGSHDKNNQALVYMAQ